MNTESLRTDGFVSIEHVGSSIEDTLNKYADMVFRLAFARTKSRYDADDILQEVFLRYIRLAPGFESEEHCKAWLIRVTINCSKSFLGSAWMRRISPFPDDLSCEMREHSEVYSAVMELPVKYRTVIHLYYYEGYKVSEIASITGAKESAVKSRLHRSRELLRGKLSGDEFDV